MAGNKNSGRKTMSEMERRQAVISQAWKLMDEKMHSLDRDRYQFAQPLAVKSMVEQSSVDMHATLVTPEERNALEQYITKNRLAQN